MLTLFASAALCAWVSAQGSSPLTAEIQVKQFKNNRILIESLVDRGIELASAESPLRRAEACQRTAGTLAHYIARAAGNEDPDRVAEFVTLFGVVVRDGVVPNMEEAKRQSTDPKSLAGAFQEIREKTRDDLDGVLKSIPKEGKVAESDKVKSALAAIEELARKFATP
jgi:hypothetical protein